jgi:ornithine--oxo-acid transaminase
MKSSEYIALENTLGAQNYVPLDVVVARAEGVWVWDVEGQKYMDCLAAYSAVNQGHCHPRIAATMVEQAHKATLTSRAFRNDQLGRFYEKLNSITGYGRVLPMNTGAEAVETGIKAARRWGYQKKGIPADKAEILVFDGNFHGRTTTVVGFSSEPSYRDGFGPFAPGFTLLPYGDATAVRDALTTNTCAILIEPIQGEAGIIIPADGYLAELAVIARDNNVLLMVDEIQSGLGRTGKMFAFEHEGIRPDVVIIGKALSGGFYPVSAILAEDKVMDVFTPGTHGSTYGGNPLGAAIACTALDVLIDEKLVRNSAELGAYALDRLRAIKADHIVEVRGRGLWIGIEVTAEAGGARPFCEALRTKGVLCKDTHDTVIRFAPPLVITREELDWALEQVEEVLTSV